MTAGLVFANTLALIERRYRTRVQCFHGFFPLRIRSYPEARAARRRNTTVGQRSPNSYDGT